MAGPAMTTLLFVAQWAPYALRRGRHVEMMLDSDRVGDRAHYGWQSSNCSRFAATLRAYCVRLAREFPVRKLDVWNIRRARHGVIGETCRENLARLCIIDAVLEQRLTEPLCDTAMHLSSNEHGIDHPAEIDQHKKEKNFNYSGFRIDFDFADVAAVRKGWRYAVIVAIAVEAFFETRDGVLLQREREFGQGDHAQSSPDAKRAGAFRDFESD